MAMHPRAPGGRAWGEKSQAGGERHGQDYQGGSYAVAQCKCYSKGPPATKCPSLRGPCAGPRMPHPPAYLLELSFHAASCTRTAGDEGGPWPSEVPAALGEPAGRGERARAVLLALLMLALEPVDE